VESRLAVLEQQIQHVREDVGEIRDQIQYILERLDRMTNHRSSNYFQVITMLSGWLFSILMLVFKELGR